MKYSDKAGMSPDLSRNAGMLSGKNNVPETVSIIDSAVFPGPIRGGIGFRRGLNIGGLNWDIVYVPVEKGDANYTLTRKTTLKRGSYWLTQ